MHPAAATKKPGEGWEVSGGPDAKRLDYHETGLAPGHAPPLAPMEDTVRR